MTASVGDIEGIIVTLAVVALLLARATAAGVGGRHRTTRLQLLDSVTVPLAFTALVELAGKFIGLIQSR